ncbi:hypothetical protein EI546_12390 [Aequorivita sp. H23M31]|uniref:SdiA-regulated family protein n=1 Tax=Aequorivita ciconiae TaxID=2494375 RepID=A0A410G5D4_9FLAO|nr:SdiA-regulated domain-containing protein [Aequorivita sp. H23M31]QAA82469.1 hypothetical protein EI546_12390 [Aequorivita sp. H23M31]
MRENVISALIIVGVLVIVGVLWFAYENPALNPRLKEESYTIVRKWDVPKELEEISGITYLSDNKIVCVQDEEGILFIFNLDTDLIEKQINFAKSGDYEGLAIIDSTAFIVESSGKIFEVSNYLSIDFHTEVYQTPFSGKNNLESLTADPKNNRLLLAVKDVDPNSKSYKGIYAFDLESKKIDSKPIFKINLDDPIFRGKNGSSDNERHGQFYPSEIAINPVDGNIYILEGKDPKLLIMDSNEKLLQLHTLNRESFPQPEGMTFAPDGTLYISNEGKKGMANIMEVELKKK